LKALFEVVILSNVFIISRSFLCPNPTSGRRLAWIKLSLAISPISLFCILPPFSFWFLLGSLGFEPHTDIHPHFPFFTPFKK